MIKSVLSFILPSRKDKEGKKVVPLTDDEYKKVAEEALESAVQAVYENEWKTEKKCDNGDIIYSRYLSPYGKVFKFVGILDGSAETVIQELYHKGENIHKWNPTVKRLSIIKTLTDHIDVVHVIANEAAAGLVASRDFVNVRIWKKQGDTYTHALVATTHPDVPIGTKHVRGDHGPSVYILKPVEGDNNRCHLQWLLNANLRGWIPQYLIDQTLCSVLLDYITALRKQMASASRDR